MHELHGAFAHRAYGLAIRLDHYCCAYVSNYLEALGDLPVLADGHGEAKVLTFGNWVTGT